jgi:Zn-dependent metalloprotease
MLSKSKDHSLRLAQKVSGRGMETYKFQHYYRGIEVVGSMVMHHKTGRGRQVRNNLVEFDLDTQPSVSTDSAWSIAKSLIGERRLKKQPQVKILPYGKSSAKLVYWVDAEANAFDSGREVIIDAHTGKVIGNLSKDLEIAPTEVYSAKGLGVSLSVKTATSGRTGRKSVQGCTLTDLSSGRSTAISASQCQSYNNPQACQVVFNGDPMTVNPTACSAPSDQAGENAKNNSIAVLNYYKTHHNRDGYDNQGSASISVVHAGIGYDNAHWSVDENLMVYGDGDGQVFGDFTVALDVAGHELTHGVTAHTAQLTMMKESGALNEANSDFFGKMIDGTNDWAIGRKLFLDQANAKGVRDLANPHNIIEHIPDGRGGYTAVPDPANISELIPMQEPCNDTNDFCWVHLNATIPGHAAYLVTQAIGRDKAEHIYYVTLTQALTANDDIPSAANAVKTTCAQLYDSSVCNQVTSAFAQVGL